MIKQPDMNPVFKRRSIRKFTVEPVSREHLDDLLRAGLCAPSARNKQPWHFIVIDERRLLDDIPLFHPYASMILQAPLAIVVCGDLSLESNPGYLVQNCAAATENILITAAGLDLGSVWLGVYPREERMQGLRQLLSLPDHILPVTLIVIGHPDEEKPPRSDFDSSKIKFNKWK
jgi:nitroreductase